MNLSGVVNLMHPIYQSYYMDDDCIGEYIVVV